MVIVRAGDFGRGAINHNNFVRASSADLTRAGMVRGQLPLAPSRESMRFSDRRVNAQGMPRTNENSRFFSARPAHQPAVRGAVGSPAPAGAGTRGGFAPNAPSNGGWRRFDPGTRGAIQPAAPSPGVGVNRGSPQGNNGRAQDPGMNRGFTPQPGNRSPQGNAGRIQDPGANRGFTPQPGNGSPQRGGWQGFERGNQPQRSPAVVQPAPQSRPEPRSYTPQPGFTPQSRGYNAPPPPRTANGPARDGRG